MIYTTLEAAMAELASDEKRRVYRVKPVAGTNGHLVYVIATSPAAAALEVIVPENIERVSQRERYDAMRRALADTIQKHNAKLAKGATA